MMFTVTVELLTGRYVATKFNDRSEPEWPPHPARLFSAAVAAWADHGDMDDVERDALEWWETLEPPTICCSIGEFSLAKRAVVTHFVPVNDTSVVARNTSKTYEQLVAAEADVHQVTLTDKERSTAVRKLEKARAKADSDSLKYTSGDVGVDRLGILPHQRPKQARTYPTMVPDDPTVAYHWNPATGDEASKVARHITVLEQLLIRIPRLGHSSTPVAVSLSSDVKPADVVVTLEPGYAHRALGLRVPTNGQVDSLIRAYEGSAQGTEPRTMPARTVSYRRPSSAIDPPTSTIGNRWLLLEPAPSSRLMIRDTGATARTLRDALMSVCGADGEDLPEFLSGHHPRTAGTHEATGPTASPHLMILGLPFVGHRHATGEIMAIALVLPTTDLDAKSDDANWAQLNEYVRRFLDDRHGRVVFKGGGRPVVLQPADLTNLSNSARVQRWMHPAREWVSVTPVALNRNPGPLGHNDTARREAATLKAEGILADSCVHIGLPRPVSIEVLLDAPTRGTRPVHAFPPARTGKLTRVQVHARLTFPEAVQGPVVLGAGRFHGLGLFMPAGSPDGRQMEVGS